MTGNKHYKKCFPQADYKPLLYKRPHYRFPRYLAAITHMLPFSGDDSESYYFLSIFINVIPYYIKRFAIITEVQNLVNIAAGTVQ
jgi:hypothetical protein